MQAAPSYLAWMNMEGAEAARPPVLAELGRRGGGRGAGLAGVGRALGSDTGSQTSVCAGLSPLISRMSPTTLSQIFHP